MVDFVYNEENENPVGQIFSNRGGWQSNPYYHESENILFSTLNKHIRNYFSTTEVGLNGVTSHLFRENLKFEYSGIWLNINKNGD